MWRLDRLEGRCFGFRAHQKFHDYPKLVISTAEECRALCCNLGSKCINWQFISKPGDATSKECKLTDKIVRLGLEKTGTPDWCDPHPPSEWNGNKLISRSDGKCSWGEPLPHQCFGLGNVRVDFEGNNLNTEACQAACCGDPTCAYWQEIPGRGCYYAGEQGVWCEKSSAVYDGGRKCVENYCDGMESKLLGTVRNTTSIV